MNSLINAQGDNAIDDDIPRKSAVLGTPNIELDDFDTGEETEPSTVAVIELLLKHPARLDRLNRDTELQRVLFPRFLLIAEASYLVYALLLVLLLNLAPAAAYPHLPLLNLPRVDWQGGAVLSLPLAYMIGIVLAAGVCLPSFYFHGLLAGVKLNWLQITSLIGKGMASNSVLLLGILPAYVAVVLGMTVFAAPVEWLRWSLLVGLLLPFAVGLWGMRAIYLGVKDMASAQSHQWQCQRWCFLRRLVFAWSAIYAAVVPVMIYRLWEFFAGQFGAG